MDPAFGRNLDAGEPADDADFPRTPAGVRALYVQDIVHEAEIVGSRRRVRIPANMPQQLVLGAKEFRYFVIKIKGY